MLTKIAPGLALVMVLAACSQAAADQTATSTTATSTTTTSTIAPAAASAEVQELSEGLPRTGRYAFLEFTLDAASLGAIEPRTYLQEDRQTSAETYLFLELTMDNRSDTDAVNWPPTPLGLRLDDGSEADPIMVSGRPHIGLAPLNSTSIVVAFEVPSTTTFADASLVIRQPDRIAATLPLVGDLAQEPYPIELALSGSGPAQSLGVGCRQSLDVTVTGGSISIDLLDTPWPSNYGARRAATGERFLSVGVEVFNNGGSRCGGGASNFSSDDARLIVDDRPLAPITFVNIAIPLEATDTATFDFAFPADAEEVIFTIGSDEATLFELPIDLPELPDVS